jgi:hypothetical protein
MNSANAQPPISSVPILIYSHLFLGLPHSPFASSFSTKTLQMLLFHACHIPCPPNLPSCVHPNQHVASNTNYKAPQYTIFCSLLLHPIISSASCSQIRSMFYLCERPTAVISDLMPYSLTLLLTFQRNILPTSLGPNMGAATAYKTLVAIYQTKHSYIPQDHTVFNLLITYYM